MRLGSLCKEPGQEPVMSKFIAAILNFFRPRPDDFGARLTAHYGFDG